MPAAYQVALWFQAAINPGRQRCKRGASRGHRLHRASSVDAICATAMGAPGTRHGSSSCLMPCAPSPSRQRLPRPPRKASERRNRWRTELVANPHQGRVRRRSLMASGIEGRPIFQVEQLAEIVTLSAEHSVDEHAIAIYADEGEVTPLLHETPVRPYAAP